MNYSAEAKRNRRAAARSSMTEVAARRKCPRCLRKAALSARVTFGSREDGTYYGSGRVCNYCGHEVGILYGKPYGRDVTPEPGVKTKPDEVEPRS